MKRMIPIAHCPACRGPVTFWDVLSIVSPTSGISCSSCGEEVFLKYPRRMMGLTALVSLGLLTAAVLLRLYSPLTVYSILGILFGLVIVVELIVTGVVVKTERLAVRGKRA